jgi:hypothetical protein
MWWLVPQFKPAPTPLHRVAFTAPNRGHAMSHEALDRDEAVQEEVRNAARALANAVAKLRAGRLVADARLKDPRPK